MGGYSGYSAAENLAYALKSGSVDISKGGTVGGTKFEEASSIAKQLYPDATNEQVSTNVKQALTMIDPGYRAKASLLPGISTLGDVPYSGQNTDIATALAAVKQKAEMPYSLLKDQSSVVRVDAESNTSNIKQINPEYNEPRGSAAKKWAFGNTKYEGDYVPVGNVKATLQNRYGEDVGDAQSGTLYRSSTGRWQLIDQKGNLVMSGSSDATLPKIETYQPLISVEQQTKNLQTEAKTRGYGENESGISSKKTMATSQAATGISTAVPDTVVDTTQVESLQTKPTKYGIESMYKTPYLSSVDSQNVVAPDSFEGIFGSTYSNKLPYASKNQTTGLPNVNTQSLTGKTANVSVGGYFGSKRDHHVPKRSVKPKKPVGFMDIFRDVSKPKLADAYKVLYTPQPTTQKKKPVSTKKEVDRYGSVWADILFRKPASKNKR